MYHTDVSVLRAKLDSIYPVVLDVVYTIFNVNKSLALNVFGTMGQTVAAVTKAFLGVLVFLGALWCVACWCNAATVPLNCRPTELC